MLEDRREKCTQRVEYKSHKDDVALEGSSWTLRWTVPICHWLREELREQQQHPAQRGGH